MVLRPTKRFLAALKRNKTAIATEIVLDEHSLETAPREIKFSSPNEIKNLTLDYSIVLNDRIASILHLGILL